MSRESALLVVLKEEPASTSDLYDRVGYPTLVRIGLVQYGAFRAELAKLSAAGLARSETGEDGATMWRRPGSVEAVGEQAPPPSQ